MSLSILMISSLKRLGQSLRTGIGFRSCTGPNLARVLDAARDFPDPECDELLTPLRMTLRSGPAPLPSSLELEMDRFENRLERDAGRRDELLRAQERLLESLSNKECVEDHFERVSGHALADFAADPVDRTAPGQERNRPSRVERQPMARMRTRSAVLASVLAVCIVTLGSYGNDPLSAAIGEAVASESVLFGSLGETTRGHPDALLEQRRTQIRAALERIDAARTSVLGFHTGYDPTALQEAADLLLQASTGASVVEPSPTELHHLRDEILRLLSTSRENGEFRESVHEVPPLF